MSPKGMNTFPVQSPWECWRASLPEQGDKCSPTSEHISHRTSASRQFWESWHTATHHQGPLERTIAAGSVFELMGCHRQHLPANSRFWSHSFLEHPAVAALPQFGYETLEPKNNLLTAGNKSWIGHRVEGGATHRDFGEDGEQERQAGEVHADPLPSKPPLQILRNCDNLPRRESHQCPVQAPSSWDGAWRARGQRYSQSRIPGSRGRVQGRVPHSCTYPR